MARSDYNAKARAYFQKAGYQSIAKVEVYRVDPPRPGEVKGFGRFHDLFGIFDFLVVGHGETIGAQVCRYSDIANRLAKVTAEPSRGADHVVECLRAGWKVLVVGFRPGQGAPHRIVEVTLGTVMAQRSARKAETFSEQLEAPF